MRCRRTVFAKTCGWRDGVGVSALGGELCAWRDVWGSFEGGKGCERDWLDDAGDLPCVTYDHQVILIALIGISERISKERKTACPSVSLRAIIESY